MILLPLLTTLVVAAAPAPSAAAALAEAPTAVLASIAHETGIGFPRFPRIRIPGRSGKKKDSASPVEAMDRRLRRLVSQEEAWYVDNSRYGNNVTKVAARDKKPDPALDVVQVQVLYASKRGWTAVASHPDAPGKSCVVYVGYRETLPLIPRTRADANEAVHEGRPVCDH